MIFSARSIIRTDWVQQLSDTTPSIPFPASWFAIGTTRSLKSGQRRAVKLLSHDAVLFRDRAGRFGLISRFCPHMGADLSEGCIRGRHLLCPVHQWGFDTNGFCNTQIPPDRIPSANLAAFTLREWAGILFAFPAAIAAHELPQSLVPAHARFSRSKTIPFPQHWLFPALNTFDLSHFSRVHHREFVGTPVITSNSPNHMALRFQARVLKHRFRDKAFILLGFDLVDVSIDCLGGVLLIIRNHTTHIGVVIGVEPIGSLQSNLFMATFNLDVPKGWFARLLLPLKLELGRIFTTAFLKADVPVIRGMRLRRGLLLPDKDEGVIRFWDYFATLPKAVF